MGFCGNIFAGLRTNRAALILPRVDDCISLLLGSMERRASLNTEGIYYFTQGWLKGERTLLVEYQQTLAKYGACRTDAIFSVMLRNYKKAALLHTGCEDTAWSRGQAKLVADTLGLAYCELTGTLDYLKKLLTGPWEDQEFIVVPPDTMIAEQQLTL